MAFCFDACCMFPFMFVNISKCIFIILFTLGTLHNIECCDNPLLEGAELTASSEQSGKQAVYARLNGQSAWTASAANAKQSITVDLRGEYAIRSLATQGRAGSQEWVKTFSLQYGFNGRDFSDYYGPRGGTWVFKGNTDGDSVVVTRFDTPLVARYVRIRPIQWQRRISLRLELYGCAFSGTKLGLDGKSRAERNLIQQPLHSLQDNIEFRFRTEEPDGVLLYSRGSQGDSIAVQLINNKLHLSISLGGNQLTRMTVGSLLDDGMWHDVRIKRDERQLTLNVDRVHVEQIIPGDFRKLDLNDKLYVGGVPHVQRDLDVFSNFAGCLENIYFNDMDFINELKEERMGFSNHGASWVCQRTGVKAPPLTFTTRRSHLEFGGTEDMQQLNISFSFRTFEPNGLLVYHNFLSIGFVKAYLKSGRFLVQLNGEGMPQEVVLDPYKDEYNDGSWHDVTVALYQDRIITVIDQYPMITVRLFSFKSGSRFLFAGGLDEVADRGYIGCMRDVFSGGFETGVSNWEQKHLRYPDEITLESCAMVDRCSPNPCLHGGICTQDSEDFKCNCQNTGYSEPVCHRSSNRVSCTKFFDSQKNAREMQLRVDVDGSGPLPAFPVLCVKTAEGVVQTHLRHDVTGDETVDGFQEPGSYVRDVVYDADHSQIEQLINSSLSCKQQLLYMCRRARLLNTAVRNNQPYKPFSWWVSRNNEQMDYWGGSQPGSRKCQCGVQQTCTDRTLDCNCDAAEARELSDGGDLMYKEDLPVRQLRFGDTGSPGDEKRGVYRLGSLICEGDAIFDNTVTFRLPDGTIDLPPIDLGYSGDIYFEFKTSQETGTLFHVEGPEDFIEVSLVGGKQVKLELSVAGETVVVTEGGAGILNDNADFHSVHVELNRRGGLLVLDGVRKLRESEAKIPRAIHLTSKLVVGARTSYQNGYVGCMRAFSVNGRLQDLRQAVQRYPYGVQEGCMGKCASNPCLNNGQCEELYSSFTCNCRFTSFRGPICADEIGVSMTRDYMIKYTLEGNYKTTVEERVRVGFSTTSPSGFLVGLTGLKNEYMTIEVSNSARIRVVFDFGFERQEVVYPATGDRVFNEGQFHDLLVRRTNQGETLVIQVDKYPPLLTQFNVSRSSDVQFDTIRYMYIGKNESMTEGFQGCISRVEFDDIFPLKEMFQEGRPAHVVGNRDTIHEDLCGIEPKRSPPEVVEVRPPPEVDESIVSSLYNRFNSALLGGILAVVLVILVVIAVLMCRYTSRHKGDYLTREDSGADGAEDADDAVAQGRTGHHVEKMKEFFI